MKFDEYVSNVKKNNYHPDKEEIYKNIKLLDKTLIFYGSPNCGKYSQALYYISKYSNSELKYKKKIQIDNGKFIYNINLSDIHYEVDFDYLSHNSKTFWFNIYNSIKESVEIENTKKFIICKNFHKIPYDLLDIFYNYLNNRDNIVFILLTQHINFFPINIIDSSLIICFKKVEHLQSNIIRDAEISNEMLELITSKEINFVKLRNTIYEIFIKQYNIYDIIWYIMKHIKINPDILVSINKCCKLYNNNYRPIYHIERLVLLIRKYNV